MKKGAFADQIVVAIDVGTTKICVLIAKKLGKEVEVLGIGSSPSNGLKKGVVVDIAKSVKSIKAAVKEAELMAGMEVESAYVGVSGGHIRSLSSNGVVPIKNGEIRMSDVDLVMKSAKAVAIPDDQQILHVIPQFFTVDGGDRITDPVGMYGVRLEGQVHIVTGAISSVQNLIKCCEMAGVKVKDIVLEQLASSAAVLSDDEKELGVALLDIGGGTSDFAVYQNGSIRHTMVVPVAGNHFTNDVAVGLKTTLKDAERVKREYGIASFSAIEEEPEILVESVHGKDEQIVRLKRLSDILGARAGELLLLIREEIKKHHLEHFISTSIVLTGGGSLLVGLDELSHTVFGFSTRVGIPQTGSGIPASLESPIYATAYGLLIHAMKKSYTSSMSSCGGPLLGRVFSRMRSWVADFF